MPASEIATFLQSRRARLQPEELGLVAYGGRRRVPGLRREELAQLAGVSVSYYVRLEQGQARGASDEVLDSIARVLRLDADERAHLRLLVRPPRQPAVRRPVSEVARPGLAALVAAMDDVPSWVLGRWGEVLTWNRLGHALLAGHRKFEDPDIEGRRPSVPRMLFLDPEMRSFYVDWEGKVRSCVAYLRLMAGRHPDDPVLQSLVGELTVKSPEFAELWCGHQVRHCEPATYEFDHPLVGRLTLAQEVLRPHLDSDQLVVALTAAPGTPSHDALRMLAMLTQPRDERGALRPELRQG